MNKLFWITYDLGIDGDYPNLYAWLDNNKAKECGDSVAAVEHFQYKDSFIDELKKSLEESINFRNGDRIYVVYKKDNGNISGKFIIGKRKVASWTGYGTDYLKTIEEDEQ